MKEVSQDIITKKAGIDLNMEVSMDGKTIIKRKADSIVGNFLRMLYGMMGRRGSGDKRKILAYRETEWRSVDKNDSYSEIENVQWNVDDSQNPPKLSIDNRLGNWFESDDNELEPVYLYTNIPEMCGLYYPQPDTYNFDLYHVDSFDPRTGELTKGPPADWSNVDQSKWNGEMWFSRFNFKTVWRRREAFNYPQIILGKNIEPANSTSLDNFASTGSVGIEDQWLHSWIHEFDTTGTNRSEPAVSQNESEINLSRTFTNNRDYPIDVGEIGIHAKVNNNWRTLIARDTLGSKITVSANSSVTIDYNMTISNSGGGGMMSQFHQLLYRQFRHGERNVRDINNNDQSGDNDGAPNQFIGASVGGGQDQTPDGSSKLGAEVGPVPGVTTNQLANTNVSLGGDPSSEDGRVPHGEGDGELYYSSALVEDIHVDQANNEIWFDISRLMENRGSTTITVNETGMYVGSTNYDNQDYPEYAVMISRHILDAPVDIVPGEVFKLKYRYKVVV